MSTITLHTTTQNIPVASMGDAARMARRRPAAALTTLAVLLLACSVPGWASWTSLSSGTRQALRAVQFPLDARTGYVVGDHGTILKTVDGGASWKKQRTPTIQALRAVHFPVDAVTGYAVGLGGVALKTTNGGASWSALNSGTRLDLMAVNFPVDAVTGYAVGMTGVVLKTTDGGASWSAQRLPYVSVLTRVQFPQDTLTGYIAGTEGTSGVIYKTIDGGVNWAREVWLDDEMMRGMAFPRNAGAGYVVSWRKAYKSVDGGVNWPTRDYGISEAPEDVHFPRDADTGFIVGAQGVSYKTTDGGATWLEGGTGAGVDLHSVHFADNLTGYAVGDGGSIVKTADGGGGNTFSLFMHPVGHGSVTGMGAAVGCDMHWDCVNDQPDNAGSGFPAPVDGMGYVTDSAAGRDMFALADGLLPAGRRITAIKLVMVSQNGGPYINLSYQRMGIDAAPVDSPAFYAGSGDWYKENSWMWTGLDWTAADLDALEIGLRNASGYYLAVPQLYVKVYYR